MNDYPGNPADPGSVICPRFLVNALTLPDLGWTDVGGAEGQWARLMAPGDPSPGLVIIPLDRSAPSYGAEMRSALARLAGLGVPSSLLEGVVTPPDEGILP